MRLTQHLLLGAKLQPREYAHVAVVAALFLIVMAAVGIKTTTVGKDWYGRCKDEGDEPEEG